MGKIFYVKTPKKMRNPRFIKSTPKTNWKYFTCILFLLLILLALLHIVTMINGNFKYRKMSDEISKLQEEVKILSDSKADKASLNELPKSKVTTKNSENRTDNDKHVSLLSKDNNSSLSASDEEKQRYVVATNMASLYLSDSWRGNTTIIDGFEVSLSEEGRLRVDGIVETPKNIHPYCSIDYPIGTKSFIHDVFLLGDGTYRIENNHLVKYSRGKQISLSGGTLNWNGMDTNNYRPYDIEYYYDKVYDKLFIVASSIPYDLTDKELQANVGLYLYVIPDRSKSEIKFLKQIKNLITDETGLYILDTSNDVWKYEEQNGNPLMKNTGDKTLKNKFPYFFEENAYSISWAFAFNDGYIGKRDEFPEGTFTYPVTTTP